ncbi:hypothetical protein [Roseiconus lacunae]
MAKVLAAGRESRCNRT